MDKGFPLEKPKFAYNPENTNSIVKHGDGSFVVVAALTNAYTPDHSVTKTEVKNTKHPDKCLFQETLSCGKQYVFDQ